MPDRRWDVLGVGCNSVDYVYRVPAAPVADSPTARLRISSHSVMCGGQTATAMAACARWGMKAAYLGCVGSDDNGRLVASALHRHGVDASPALVRGCANRFAVITVDGSSGERIVLWDRDERLDLAEREIAPDIIRSARLVHVDDEDQAAAITTARIARAAGIPVTSDIDRITGRTRELMQAVSVPVLSEHVLPAMTGETDPERGLRALRCWHDGMLCVTLGAAGAMLLSTDELYAIPAFPVAAVDTTAAGDVFRAGLIFSLVRGDDPLAMLRFAAAAAAVSCTRAGAMDSVPALEDVEAVIAGRSPR